MTNKVKTASLEDRLAEKRDIESRLADVKEQLHQPHLSQAVRAKAGLKAGEWRMRVQNLKAKGESLTTAQKGELKGYEAELSSIMASQQKVKAEYDRLEQEEANCEDELANYAYICSEEELCETQGELQIVLAEILELNKAITHQEEVINESRTDTPDIGPAKSKHQEVLADLALGKSCQEDLDKAEKSLAKISKDKETGAALVKQAEAAIAGLRRRLAAAEDRAATLQADLNEAACYYLVNRAGLVNERYSHMVANLGKEYGRLLAIGGLLEKISGGSFPSQVTAFRTDRLFVPGFNIGAPSAISHPHGLLNTETLNLDAAAQEEQQRIKAMGVTLN